MLVCLDIGNTHIYGGVFVGDAMQLRFRYPSSSACTSDTFGIFLKEVLKNNGIDPQSVKAICLCSVVPTLEYSIVAACRKYFAIRPLQLKPGSKTGIALSVKAPQEVGADRIANAIAAAEHFKGCNLLIVDFGTATTLCAVSKDKAYLGGAILPGIKLSMEALSQKAAKLSNVEILYPEQATGKNTTENLQSGLYYSQLGAIKELATQIERESFQGAPPMRVLTGGYAHLFEHGIDNCVNIPDLVLHGLRLVWEKNPDAARLEKALDDEQV